MAASVLKAIFATDQQTCIAGTLSQCDIKILDDFLDRFPALVKL